MKQYQYSDPAKQIDYEQRRDYGCYSCYYSKRGKLDGRMRSYCERELEGVIQPDYPDETKDTCDEYIKFDFLTR